jgi:transcriptional regulator GlxA family with amidase domain
MMHMPHRNRPFEQALRLIRQRACEGATVEQILDSVHVSRKTLERDFLLHLGRTPGQELIRLRIERAKHLLCTTYLPIKRVAFMTGFCTNRSATNFSAFFRRETGVSPSAFRHAHRGAETIHSFGVQSRRPHYPHKRIFGSENQSSFVATATLN